jgi:tetratricopeptide (TPR) repeat protein
MQRKMSKKIHFFFIASFFSGWLAAQPAQEYLLNTGDSLFEQGKYMEAMKVYDKILHQYQAYSPQMLLKMAYISEGKDDPSMALYYLYLYYKDQPMRSVYQKISQLALANQLKGYEFTDRDYFSALFYNYFDKVLIAVYVVLVVLLLILIRSRIKGHDLAVPATTLCLVVVACLWVINVSFNTKHAIIQRDGIFVMQDASPGSKVVVQLNRGHRLEVLGGKDIWTRVRWQDEEGYVRSNNLLPLN